MMNFDASIGPFDDFRVVVRKHFRQLVQELGNRMVLSVPIRHTVGTSSTARRAIHGEVPVSSPTTPLIVVLIVEVFVVVVMILRVILVRWRIVLI